MSALIKFTSILAITCLLLLPGCGGESSEGESDASEVKAPETPEEELILAMDEAIRLVEADSIRAMFEKFTPPDDMARIDSAGVFNQVKNQFNIFKLDFVRALKESQTIQPEFNEDTTMATYEVVEVEVPGHRVKFQKIEDRWYFSD
jgi:hypothetical protein